jgi:hypothetical protein
MTQWRNDLDRSYCIYECLKESITANGLLCFCKTKILLLHLFHVLDSIQNFSLARFFDFPSQHELIQYGINLVEIKDNIQFTNIAEVTVQELHKQMDGFQVGQFIVVHIHRNREEKTRVSSVDELVVVVFNEIGVFLVAGCDKSVHFGFNAGLLRFHRGSAAALRWHVPTRKYIGFVSE